MQWAEFTDAALADMRAVECGCGGHAFATKIVVDGAQGVADVLPAGAVAALYADDDAAAGAFARALRKKGVGTRRLPVGRCEADAAVPPQEDVRLLVAVGGEAVADFVKRCGKLHSLPVFVAVSDPSAVTVLDEYCALYDGDVLRLSAGAVPISAALLPEHAATHASSLPSAFGGIISVAAALFDKEAYARATGTAGCAEVRKAAFSLVYRALDVCAEYGRADARLPAVLAEIALRLSLLSQAERGDMLRGSADGCARAADMLLRREERTPFPRGESAFLFGAVLGKMFRALCDAAVSFVPPPDNNLRAEKLTDILGLGETVAARAAVKRVRRPDLAAYRVREYRDELGDIAGDTERIFAEANRLFRRMYADDGFSLRGRLDGSDVRAAISLSPDLFPVRGNALLLLREFGLLDRYL